MDHCAVRRHCRHGTEPAAPVGVSACLLVSPSRLRGMYIGAGTLVLILIIVLIIYFIRRA